MRFQLFAVFVCCVLLAVGHGRAELAAQTEANFPLGTIQARPAGLGGAGAALSSIEFAGLNPAAFSGTRGVTASYREQLENVLEIEVLSGHAVAGFSTGIRVKSRAWMNIAADLGLSDLSLSERSLGLLLSRNIGEAVALGVEVSRLDADYLGARALGWSTSGGAQLRFPGGVSLGAALLHLGNLRMGAGEAATLPTRVVVGGSTIRERSTAQLLITTDVAFDREFNSADVFTGLEVSARAGHVTLSARAGAERLAARYSAGRATNFTIGAGASAGRVQVDFSRTTAGSIGGATYVALAFMW